MDPGTIGVFIPIIAIVMGISLGFFGVWTQHRQKIAKIEAEASVTHTAEKAAQYASGVKSLEDRVRVLERIVTDRGYDVATQIEALRDTRDVEEKGSGIPLDIRTQEKA